MPTCHVPAPSWNIDRSLAAAIYHHPTSFRRWSANVRNEINRFFQATAPAKYELQNRPERDGLCKEPTDLQDADR
jgi:hypothetical protein